MSIRDRVSASTTRRVRMGVRATFCTNAPDPRKMTKGPPLQPRRHRRQRMLLVTLRTTAAVLKC
mgnify:CR=1 FL=1